LPKIVACYSTLEIDPINKISATKLRGFFGYLFINDPEFHHHSESSFHYPLVQYKMINNTPCILGLQEYAEVVFRKISQLEHIMLPHGKVRIQSVKIDMVTSDIKKEEHQYRFMSPWLALNQDNYSRYTKLGWNERKHLLGSIFIGNILSALKGLKVFINFRILAEIQNFKQLTTVAHDNQFVGFHANIRTNINLPQHIGIGKSVAKGFGTIEGLK
jgi:hypothetical protein